MKNPGIYLALALTLSTGSLSANVGDAIEVDHENLISFSSDQDISCRFSQDSPNTKYQRVAYAIRLYIEYSDGRGEHPSRKILQPLEGDALCLRNEEDCNRYCDSARQKAFDALASWNLFLNDVKKDNLTADPGYVCRAKYFVATLRDGVTIGPAGKADYADIKWSTKAAKCP